MADTTSPLLGLLLMETGGDNNAWGANLNAQVITLIENAIAGVVTVSGLTGGSYSLAAAEARSAVLVLTGTLAADQTIVVPNTTKKYSINNQTTGNFFVLVKTASGTAVNAPQGKQTDIICYGSNVVLRADQNKIGEFFYHAGTAAPAGSFECDGSAAIRASAVDLYGVIGTTWGVGNGLTTFNLPDGKTTGRFLRSRTASVTIGTSQSNQNKSHTHTGSGTTGIESVTHTHNYSGTTGAMSANATHTHGHNAISGTSTTGGGGFTCGGSTAATIGGANIDHTHVFSGTTSGISADHTHAYSFTTSTGSADGTEARPESLVGMLCIRY